LGGGSVTIQDLGSIGDFVGGIGVVVTLAFLIFQIRQNTAQLRQQNKLSAVSAARASREGLNEIYAFEFALPGFP
jgi:hypothetical protein